MRRDLAYLIAFLSMTSLLAQSPVIGLFEGEEFGETNNAYYKDTQGDLDKFVGTWVWSKGTVTWKIELRLLKEELIVFDLNNKKHRHYTDLLIGEMVYTENGKELINSLGRFEDPTVQNWDYNISGNYILDGLVYCNDCDPSERRVALYFIDPNHDYIENRVFLRHLNTGIYETLELFIWQSFVDDLENPNRDAPPLLTMPYGTYTLVKQ